MMADGGPCTGPTDQESVVIYNEELTLLAAVSTTAEKKEEV
jgi:hypothetical protein